MVLCIMVYELELWDSSGNLIREIKAELAALLTLIYKTSIIPVRLRLIKFIASKGLIRFPY